MLDKNYLFLIYIVLCYSSIFEIIITAYSSNCHNYADIPVHIRVKPMQLYTIQLPGTDIIRHGWLSRLEQHCICALPRYSEYLLKFASCTADKPWIPRLDNWQAASIKRPCTNVKMHAVHRYFTSGSDTQWMFFLFTQQESFPPSSWPAHICFDSTRVDLPWLAYHSLHTLFAITRTSTFCSTSALLSGTWCRDVPLRISIIVRIFVITVTHLREREIYFVVYCFKFNSDYYCLFK